VNKNWSSRWYANTKNFAPMLAEDIKVRDFLKRKLAHASVGKCSSSARRRMRASPSSPRVRRGDRQEGEEIEARRRSCAASWRAAVHVNIEEIRKPEMTRS